MLPDPRSTQSSATSGQPGAALGSFHALAKRVRSYWRGFWWIQRSYWRYTLAFFLAAILVLVGLSLFVDAQIPAGASLQAGAARPWQVPVAWLMAALLLTALLMLVWILSTRRLRRVTDVVQRIALGDTKTRILPGGGDEIGRLSRAINHLAEKLERQTRAADRDRERLQTVLHTMSDGAVMLDQHGHVNLVNPAATRLLRIDADMALRQSFVQVVRDYRIADVWQQCMEQNAEQTATIELTPGFFLRVIVAPFFRGTITGYLVLLQDLSHLYRLEAVRRDFISNISHELRTPLASIKALVDTLRDGAIEDPPAAERFLQHMEVEIDEMTQMVQELLELSRIESGQAPLRLFPSPVAPLVEPAVERLRTQAERASVALAVVLPAGLPQVMVDVDRIRTVIMNLVHNAIKFTPNGGHVTVSARAVHEGVVISVADTGIGIPSEDLPRIFERFFKTDRARAGGGTGLGLAIAKHAVQAHNGRIWVESVEGQGSTFSFTLPLVNLPLTSFVPQAIDET